MSTKRHISASSLASILLLAVLVACSEVIDLETSGTGGDLVIYGRITNGTQGNEIRISRTGFLGQDDSPVNGANVTVHDENGIVATYVEVGDGSYAMAGNTPVAVPGESYYLKVEFVGGKTYQSQPEVMPVVSAKDSLYYEVRTIEETSELGVTSERFVVSVFSDTEIFDPRSDLFIKWDLDEVFSFEQAVLPMHNFPFYFRHTCYMTSELEPQRVLLYDGSELRATSILGRLQTDRSLDESFRAVHYFNLIQQSLPKGAMRFWQGLNQNVNRVGSIFDQPPGELPTNLYNVDDPSDEILGYFEVMAADTARLKVTNSDLGQFFPEPCPKNPEVDFAPFMNFRWIARFYEPECLDCLVLPNSSHNRPSYFD